MRFLGVDLAWKDGNPSGLVLLGGQRFPLHLREVPHTLKEHAGVLDWIAHHVTHHRAAVGIDAPLLGLETTGHRAAERALGKTFQRFDAPAFPPPKDPDLRHFVGELRKRWPLEAFGPSQKPTSGNPAIREVYPNAFQVGLFRLDLTGEKTIVKYKRKKNRFRRKADWVENGLKPFVARCARTLLERHLIVDDPSWQAFAAEAPHVGKTARELKSIEDRWDALICAFAVAFEFFEPGSMRFYPDGALAWRRGYILAPALPARR